MQSIIVDWCHIIGVTDPVSISVAVGVVAAAIPALIIYAILRALGTAAQGHRSPPISN
jgi:hypothetical protein